MSAYDAKWPLTVFDLVEGQRYLRRDKPKSQFKGSIYFRKDDKLFMEDTNGNVWICRQVKVYSKYRMTDR